MPDYYAILGLAPDATTEQIKAAYRRLAAQFHPDRSGADTTAQFQEIQRAYEVLSSPDKRRAFDAGGNPDNQVATYADSVDAEAQRGLQQLIDQVFDNWDEEHFKLYNMAQEIERRVQPIIHDVRRNKRKTVFQLRKLRQLRKRLKGNHWTMLHLQQKRLDLLRRWLGLRHNIRVLKRIAALAEAMEYRVDPREEPVWVRVEGWSATGG